MISNDRYYLPFEMRAEQEEMRAVGYAAVFEQPTVLFSEDGIDYSEVVDRDAFSGCKMEDVVMNYNHKGKPVARTKNGTLELTVDELGLKVNADLSGTQEARQLYEEIKGGYIDKMSFAFTVKEDSYDVKNHTRRICKIDRLFDVAAVDIPAYEQTMISARSFFEVEAEKEAVEAAEREAKIKRLILMAQI